MVNIKKSIMLTVPLILVAASLAYAFSSQLQPRFHGVGVLKSADAYAYVGDIVTYQIKVYNPSDYDLYKINVTDPMLGLNETIPFMAARNITGIIYTFQREVLETDTNPLVNTVTIEAIDSVGVYSSASTQAITKIAQHIISISKVGPETAYEGERITYTITLNNTGNFSIPDVVLEDEMLGFSWRPKQRRSKHLQPNLHCSMLLLQREFDKHGDREGASKRDVHIRRSLMDNKNSTSMAHA